MRTQIINIIEQVSVNYVVRCNEFGIEYITFKAYGRLFDMFDTGHVFTKDGKSLGKFDSVGMLKRSLNRE